jgi:hypothetical protein
VEGTGVVETIDQRVPSKCSASGTPRKVVAPASAYPTAYALVGLTAADATRSGPVWPAGLGLGTTCNAVPAAAAPSCTKQHSCLVYGQGPGSVQTPRARRRLDDADGGYAAAARPKRPKDHAARHDASRISRATRAAPPGERSPRRPSRPGFLPGRIADRVPAKYPPD